MDIATGFKKVRQAIASLSLATLLSSMLLTGVAQAAVADYTDVPASHWAYSSIMSLANAGVVKAQPEVTKYNPADSVTRAVMAQYLVKAVPLTLENPASPSFTDVAKDAWYYQPVETLSKNGVASGYKDANGNLTGKFGPADMVTRAQAAKMLVKAFNLKASSGPAFTDVNAGDWFYADVQTAAHWSLFAGNNGAFRPNDKITRAEMAKVIVAAQHPVEAPDVPVQTGNLKVALSNDTPVSGVVLNGQATADLAHFTFTGTGTVTSVTLTRAGLSDQSTLSNVYLYDGATRLTDGYSFNTQGTIVMNNLNIAVSGSKTIAVKADVSATAVSGTVQAWLTSFTDGSTPVAVNLSGSMMSINSASGLLATATLSANTVSAANVNPGVVNYTVWSAPLQVNTRSVWLKGANFRLIGSAEAGALANVKLYKDGVDTGVASTQTLINGSNYIVFDLTSAPLEVTTGSHTFDVRGDIIKGSARTLQISLQQASDLMLFDKQIGVNIAVGGTIANNGGTITINAGSLTVTLDTGFQAMTKITGGSANATIAKYTLFAYGEDIKANTITVLPVLGTMTPAAAGLQNVTLYFNGSQVGSQTASWSSGNINFTPGSQMIIPAGVKSTLEVRADLRTTGSVAYTAGTVSANLVAGTGTVEGMISKNTLNVPALTGNTLTVQTGNLSVSKNIGYAHTTVSPNTSGVRIGSFNLQNLSTSESVRVTSLTVATTTAGGSLVTDYSSIKTSETSGNANTPVQPSQVTTTTSSNVFSTDFTLDPNASKTVDILVDANSVPASGTIVATLNVSYIGKTSNIASTSSTITGQTVTFNSATITNPPTLVADSTSSTVAQYIAAANGSVDGSKATFNLGSTNGDAKITELKFVVGGTSGAVTGLKVGANGTPSSVQTVGGVDTISVSGLDIPVANGGGGLNQAVYVTYAQTGTNGVASGSTGSVSLAYVEYKTGSTTKTLCTAAVATAFGVTCTAVLGSAVAAPTMTLVGSKPTFDVVDTSDTLTNGLVKIAEVTVTADAKGDIKLGKLPISVSSTGVVTVVSGADNIVVKDTNNSVIATTNTGLGVAAGGTGTDTIIFGTNNATSYLIPAGTSKTFRIYTTAATVSGAVNTTSLSTTLGAAGSVEWYDVAGSSSVAKAASLIFNYPTTTSVITN